MERVKKMNSSRRWALFLLFVLSGTWGVQVRSEEVSGKPTAATAPLNPFLVPKLEEIIKTAMRVIREEEGVVYVTLSGNHSFVAETPILFFRKKGSRLEVIATGKVLTEAAHPKTGRMEIHVELDKDTVIKYPVEGDFAAPLSDPNALGNGNKQDQSDFLMPEEDASRAINDRPGYLELGAGLIYGQLATTTSTVANFAKQSSAYRFQNIHFAYFSDFFPVGVSMDSHEGNFPTSTYNYDVVASKESVSLLGFYYRFSPLFDKKLELALKVTSLSDRFLTDNADENLLSTEVSGMGAGIRARYDFAPLLWKPAKDRWFDLTLQGMGLEFSYFPTLTANDVGVSRGSDSNGSTGIQFRASATALVWLKFIPWVKRWVFEGSYGFRSYQLKFNGPTVPEAIPVPIPIATGTRATERESDFRFFVGFRIDDPIRSLFSDGKGKR
jgi:hypothetical protein